MTTKPLSSLPVNEKSFEISVMGDTTNQLYTGQFVSCCVPTLGMKADAAVMEARLNSDLKTLDDGTVMFNRILAQLAYRIKAAPDWFLASANGRELLDLNVLFEIWSKCVEAEKEWREKVWGKSEEKKEIEKTE